MSNRGDRVDEATVVEARLKGCWSWASVHCQSSVIQRWLNINGLRRLSDEIGRIGKSWFLLVMLACMQCTILWIVQYPPLDDYPNHLLRHHILASLLKGEAAFQQYFAAVWRPVPYLSSDLLAVPLGLVTNPIIAGKLVLSIYVIGFPLCFAYFAKRVVANGHVLWPYGFLFTYNHFFQKGYVNYCLGSTLFLLLAGYVGFQSVRAVGAKHVAVVSILSIAAYFSHLWAWMASVIYLAAVALRGRKQHPGIVIKYLGALSPSGILFGVTAVQYVARTRPSVQAGLHMGTKLSDFAGTFLTFWPQLESLVLAAPLVLLAVAAGKSVLKGNCQPFLVAALILLAAFLVIPNLMYLPDFGRRFLWFSVLLACPAVAKWPRLQRAGTLLSLLAAVALVTSTGFIYFKLSRQLGSDVDLMRQMPVGAMALPIEPEQLKVGLIRPYRHAAAYYGVYRNGIVPWGYATGWHPITYISDLPAPSQAELRNHSVIAKLARQYSWMLVWGKEQISFQPPPDYTLWRDNSHLYIYKNERPGVELRE